MIHTGIDIVVIGGSSGSIGIITSIVNALPAGFNIPVIIIIHRKKNVTSELKRTLSSISRKVTEPEDKERITDGGIYLAPQNYHLLIEHERIFSLDYSEPEHFSRPSIDVTFLSVAEVYKHSALAILLSGANRDGAAGIAGITARGGRAIVQDPATAEYPLMPEAAIKNNINVEIHSPQNIVDVLLRLK